MPKAERLKFLLWAGNDEHQLLLEETHDRLSAWAKKFSKPSVSVSGGKDSTVALHLALQHWDPRNIIVWHWDYGDWLMPRPYENEVLRNIRSIIGRSGARLLVAKRPGGRESRSECAIGYRAFFGSLKRMIRWHNRDVTIAGLRASESKSRASRVKEYEEFHNGTEVMLLHPLADWKAGDVWAYIMKNKLSYPSIYDRYAKIHGYDSESLRFVTFFDREMDVLGVPLMDGILSWRFRHQTDG